MNSQPTSLTYINKVRLDTVEIDFRLIEYSENRHAKNRSTKRVVIYKGELLTNEVSLTTLQETTMQSRWTDVGSLFVAFKKWSNFQRAILHRRLRLDLLETRFVERKSAAWNGSLQNPQTCKDSTNTVK